MKTSRRRLFGFLAAAPIAGVAALSVTASPVPARLVNWDKWAEKLRKAEFIEKGVRPPLAMGVLKNESASIMPGYIAYVNTICGKPVFKPAFEVNAGLLCPIGKST